MTDFLPDELWPLPVTPETRLNSPQSAQNGSAGVTTAAGAFKDAENVTELIYQLVGAGSVCWVGGTGGAVFDSTQAARVAEAGIDRLIELGWAPQRNGAQP